MAIEVHAGLYNHGVLKLVAQIVPLEHHRIRQGHQHMKTGAAMTAAASLSRHMHNNLNMWL